MSTKDDDLRFNRVTKHGQRTYLTEYANGRVSGDESYTGTIKCKLVHNDGYSLVLPDQVYVDIGGEVLWFQPLYYTGCVISQHDDEGKCQISIDISHCIVLSVRFESDSKIQKLSDCSILYKCLIKAPKYLHRYATGRAMFSESGPQIKLFHHTNKKAKDGINASSEYWSSAWNIRGTKKLINIHYLYLTSLPAIQMDEDLVNIAMSSDGIIAFQTDLNSTGKPELVLTVYRESTKQRTHTLSHWVNATDLATQPAYRHFDPTGIGYHEVVCPYVHRIGVEPGTSVGLTGNLLQPHAKKDLGYAVVGDATKINGLAAPYDEEQTNDVFKIECMKDGQDIISYWFANPNSNRFDSIKIESGQLIEPDK